MTTLLDWYQEQVKLARLNYDPAQQQLINELNQFLNHYQSLNFITRLWRKEHKLGYYIYGDVGRGKTMVMNAMYQHTPGKRKTRQHFHAFMQDIHNQLGQLAKVDNPLRQVARQLKRNFDIIYLDEMHISDIATAMIMQNLLNALFAEQIYIITSSNYHPDLLWPDGLMRERFLPAIALIKEKLMLASLNSQQDYRLLHHSANQLFMIGMDSFEDRLQQLFKQINGPHPTPGPHLLNICQRQIACRNAGPQIAWFEFNILCGAMRSQLDYLELANRYDYLILSGLYQLTANEKDIARRFTWLIDVLYDHNCILILASTVAIKQIYIAGDYANEFTRTVSRLEEMQTEEYLQKKLTSQKRSAYNNALENKKLTVNGA